MVSKMVNDSFVYSMRCIVIGLKLETLQMKTKKKTIDGKIHSFATHHNRFNAFNIKKKKKLTK